jgi:hypothetical protein
LIVLPGEYKKVLNRIAPDPESISNINIVVELNVTGVVNVNTGYRTYGVDDASRIIVFENATGGP